MRREKRNRGREAKVASICEAEAEAGLRQPLSLFILKAEGCLSLSLK